MTFFIKLEFCFLHIQLMLLFHFLQLLRMLSLQLFNIHSQIRIPFLFVLNLLFMIFLNNSISSSYFFFSVFSLSFSSLYYFVAFWIYDSFIFLFVSRVILYSFFKLSIFCRYIISSFYFSSFSFFSDLNISNFSF